MTTPEYGYQTVLEGVSYEDAINRVTEALKTEGFGVITEIDVTKTMKEKLGEDFRNYKILGACNPGIAHKALTEELGLGLLLPCNVTVYSDDAGNSVVAIAKPQEMFKVVSNEKLAAFAEDVEGRVKRVMAALK